MKNNAFVLAMMKHYIIILCAVILCITTGCPEEISTVDYIQSDKNEILFSACGGSDTITMLANSDVWWLSCVTIQKTEKVFYQNCNCNLPRVLEEVRYYHSSSAKEISMDNVGWYEFTDSAKLETDWLDLYIPEDELNKCVIKCKANADKYERHIVVILQDSDVEDRICDIDIYQESSIGN